MHSFNYKTTFALLNFFVSLSVSLSSLLACLRLSVTFFSADTHLHYFFPFHYPFGMTFKTVRTIPFGRVDGYKCSLICSVV